MINLERPLFQRSVWEVLFIRVVEFMSMHNAYVPSLLRWSTNVVNKYPLIVVTVSYDVIIKLESNKRHSQLAT